MDEVAETVVRYKIFFSYYIVLYIRLSSRLTFNHLKQLLDHLVSGEGRLSLILADDMSMTGFMAIYKTNLNMSSICFIFMSF